ncbi:MAG TPA: calcium-binding protein, partial [Elainellaceae cyanobacterium]
GRDTLIAGRGYDELYGGPGNDIYIVKSYNFKIVERRGPSNDTLRIPLNYELDKTEIENLVLLGKAKFGTGSARNNSITGNRASNVLSGLKGNDSLYGKGRQDSLYGNQGKDLLDGGKGNDRLYGQEGNDTLLGDRGNDLLIGDRGNDTLNGYGGSRRERDRLEGGDNADTFVLGDEDGVFYRGRGHATVLDFERRERDKIQVSGNRRRDYRIVKSRNFSGSSSSDTAIFKGRDLIAIIEDTTTIGVRDLISVSPQ